jgi:hypothetical protein
MPVMIPQTPPAGSGRNRSAASLKALKISDTNADVDRVGVLKLSAFREDEKQLL